MALPQQFVQQSDAPRLPCQEFVQPFLQLITHYLLAVVYTQAYSKMGRVVNVSLGFHCLHSTWQHTPHMRGILDCTSQTDGKTDQAVKALSQP